MFCNYFCCCHIQSETKPPSAGAVSPVTFGVRSGMATGTRSARQMGTLLTMLQEQGQRQEQLACEQANQFSLKLEQLAEEQRERQAEFSRQFSEQLELLAWDQRLTLEQWTARQERMEERVRTLEAVLRSSIREPLPKAVKAELPEKSCLGTTGTEPSCPLEIESQASSLNPDATEFLPLPTVQETEGEATGVRSGADSHLHRQMQRPGSYDG